MKWENRLVSVLVFMACIGGIVPDVRSNEGSGNTSALVLPDLSGTPYESLSKAMTWIVDFKKDVVQAMNRAAARIGDGEGVTPEQALKTLEARLTSDKALIANTNGLLAVMVRQEQKMIAEMNNVEKRIAEQDTDGPMKQEYGDTLSEAQKSLDSYRCSRATVDILAKKVDVTLTSVEQWKKFYASTAGITGAEAARKKLSGMITKASAEWEK